MIQVTSVFEITSFDPLKKGQERHFFPENKLRFFETQGLRLRYQVLLKTNLHFRVKLYIENSYLRLNISYFDQLTNLFLIKNCWNFTLTY